MLWHTSMGKTTSEPVYEIYDLKDFLIEITLERAGWSVLSSHNYIFNQNTPYKNKNGMKKLSNAFKLLHIAEPSNIDYILSLAKQHFENKKHRALTILFSNVPLKTAQSLDDSRHTFEWKFNYYFAIRIRKIRDGKGYRAFIGIVGSFCPFGQIVHYKVKDNNELCTPLGDPWLTYKKVGSSFTQTIQSRGGGR